MMTSPLLLLRKMATLPPLMMMLLLLSSSRRFYCDAFYVPGVQPATFTEGSAVPLKVNSLTSKHTQIPRDYYHLPFCQPDEGPKMASENLGEFLTGNKIQSSPYQLYMKLDAYCRKLCQVTLRPDEANYLRYHVRNGYRHNWIIDNLPSAFLGIRATDGVEKKRYAGGFPVGFMDPTTEEAYLYNHVNLHVDYHPVNGGGSVGSGDNDDRGYRVVGFAVEPLSVEHAFAETGYQWDGYSPEGFDKELGTCPSSSQHLTRENTRKAQVVTPGVPILYTYDVIWKRNDEIRWSSRWDVYLSEDHMIPAKVHWYSITNSILIVLFLSILVISILVRNLKRDIAAYNALAKLTDEENKDMIDADMDETGWKLVHADVFRPPATQPMLYCVFVGTGAQLCVTAGCAIVLSAVGFLSPARRGSLVNAFLAFYALSGVAAGYLGSRLYKSFRGTRWQACTTLTALLFPGISFGLFLTFNVILYLLGSSASAPWLDVIIVAAMWFGVSVPLVFAGAYLGYKADAIEFPTVTSSVARAIPPPASPIFNPMVGMIATGVIPFAAAYVELFFIMTSLWMDRFYYVFGFTLIVYLIMIITCAELTVLLVYYQLCEENHRWWWYSFFCSGSTAFYTFAYSLYWFKSLEASRNLMTYMLYFGYMFLICFAMLLVFGMVGTMTSLWFIRKIFGTIKVD